MTPTPVCRSQLARMLQLVMLLQEGSYPGARQLAAHCEVSRRTIYRDLGTLQAAGVPVEYVAARQGFRLAPGFRFEPPRLDGREVEALLVLVLGHADDWPGLAGAARIALGKLAEGFEGPGRDRLQALAEALGRDDGPEEDEPGAPRRMTASAALLEAAATRQRVRLWPRDELGGWPPTVLSPYRLRFARGDWWVIGRSAADGQVLTLRLRSIARAEPTGETFEVPPRFRPGGGACERGVEVHLRLASDVVDAARATWPGGSPRLTPRADGGHDWRATAGSLGPLAAWVLGLGDGAEALAPPELRRLVAELAARAARRHGLDPATVGG